MTSLIRVIRQRTSEEHRAPDAVPEQIPANAHASRDCRSCRRRQLFHTCDHKVQSAFHPMATTLVPRHPNQDSSVLGPLGRWPSPRFWRGHQRPPPQGSPPAVSPPHQRGERQNSNPAELHRFLTDPIEWEVQKEQLSGSIQDLSGYHLRHFPEEDLSPPLCVTRNNAPP